jgi:phospholipase C
LNLNVCIPEKLGTTTPCIKPWDADNNKNIQATDLPHGSSAAQNDYDKGKMDGFVSSLSPKTYNYTMAYYTSKTIPDYWDYASYYTLNDYFFASALSMSLPNHLYAVAASDGCPGPDCRTNFNGPTSYNLTFPQIAEYLTPLGLTWGYYQYGWNDKADCPPTASTYTPSYVASHLAQGDSYWTGLTDFTQVQMTKIECSSLLNYKDLMNSISAGTLPNVAWVIPESSESDHPGQSLLSSGQEYIASVVNAISKSSEWSSTVIYITNDEWGGYYDGVAPLQIDTQGVGFRVPLIAISPYSIQGAIVHGPTYTISSGTMAGKQTAQEDFSAFLSTIEYNWNLPSLEKGVPLTERDKDQPNLFYMLNFKQAPLKPLILPSNELATYPYTTCVSQKLCSDGPQNPSQPSPVSLFVPQPYTWTESVAQALNYSGTGDADD